MKKNITTFIKKNAIYVILIILLIVFGIGTDTFFTLTNMLIVSRQICMIMIASVGMMFVLISGGIDLSIGSMVSLVNVIAATLMVNHGWHPFTTCVFVIALMVGVGCFQGFLVARFKMPAIIVTLGFMEILSGLAYMISGGMPISKLPESFLVMGQGSIGIVPIPVFIMAGIIVLGWFITNKTYFGRNFYAVGGNEDAALLSGINIRNIRIMVFGFSAFFASFAGVVLISRLNAALPSNGLGFELEVIIAVVLGGISIAGGSGRISGAVAGAFIIGIMKNGMTLLNFGAYTQMVVKGAVLVVAVAFDCIQKNKETVKAGRLRAVK